MPIIWRYLLSNYLKVLILCTISFIGLLLTLRLTEIAHFASLGAHWIYIAYYAFCQIPYILPIALPIAALISAVLLVQQLSKNNELSALRSAGFSLWTILTPLLFAGAFLSILNFYIVSELATNSHLSTALIKSELRCINPLLVLNNKHLMQIRGIYFDTLGASKVGESASDILIAMPSKDNQRLNLLIAKNLEATPQDFTGSQVTVLSTVEDKGSSEHLLIENIGKAKTTIKDFTQMVQKKTCSLNHDHLQMSFLLARFSDEREKMKIAIEEKKPENVIKQHRRTINRMYSEMLRRVSIAIAAFTFTLLGASCGISIGRNSSAKGIAIVVALGAFYIAAYFSAKSIDHLLAGSIIVYLLPHVLFLATSLWMLRRAAKGIA